MKSTDIEGSSYQADILVSELLDSALLGESCLYSHGDAIHRFLRKCSTLNEGDNLR